MASLPGSPAGQIELVHRVCDCEHKRSQSHTLWTNSILLPRGLNTCGLNTCPLSIFQIRADVWLKYKDAMMAMLTPISKWCHGNYLNIHVSVVYSVLHRHGLLTHNHSKFLAHFWIITLFNFIPTFNAHPTFCYLITTAISASVWWIIHRVALHQRRLERKKLSRLLSQLKFYSPIPKPIFLWVGLGNSSKVWSGTKTSTAVWNMARLCASTKQDRNSMALLECGELCHALCVQLCCLSKMGMGLQLLRIFRWELSLARFDNRYD